ncbi:965_t:CDS:1, partial [Dentiscutata erythropus]
MKQYNALQTDEVAAICWSNKNIHVKDIVIVRHNDELERISELY